MYIVLVMDERQGPRLLREYEGNHHKAKQFDTLQDAQGYECIAVECAKSVAYIDCDTGEVRAARGEWAGK